MKQHQRSVTKAEEERPVQGWISQTSWIQAIVSPVTSSCGLRSTSFWGRVCSIFLDKLGYKQRSISALHRLNGHMRKCALTPPHMVLVFCSSDISRNSTTVCTYYARALEKILGIIHVISSLSTVEDSPPIHHSAPWQWSPESLGIISWTTPS